MAVISQILSSSYEAVLNKMRPADQWSENAALRALQAGGFIKKVSLGPTIDVSLDYQANSEATTQATEMTAVTISTATSVLGGATYAVAEIVVPVKWTKKTEATNPSVNQKIDIVKGLLTNGINSHDDKVESTLFGTSSNGLLGLTTLVDDAGTGTVGGIDSGSDTFWRNQIGTAYETDYSNIEAVFTQVYNDCMKGSGSSMEPKLMLGGSEAHAGFEGQLVGQQRWVDTQEFKAGAKSLAFKNAKFVFSPYGDDHVYFLNPEAFNMVVSKEFFRHKSEVQELNAYNAYIVKLYSAMQNVVLNRSRLGVAFSET